MAHRCELYLLVVQGWREVALAAARNRGCKVLDYRELPGDVTWIHVRIECQSSYILADWLDEKPAFGPYPNGTLVYFTHDAAPTGPLEV
jgi:hypothetical protein